ncbi:MAG: Nif3-like dinuclear metal center hexameric protein, partial [Flavobacteriales bacterium]
MKLSELIRDLEQWAPPALQESYDNSGLLVGNPEMEVKGVICCLDSTPEVIQEALEQGANVVVAHHPIVFSGLKRLVGRTYVQRAVELAIKNDIAIYAIHTNLDHVLTGVNGKIAQLLELQNPRILRPKEDTLYQIVVFTPKEVTQIVRDAMFQAGAGHVGQYDQCSFELTGRGAFRPLKGANPTLGTHGERMVVEEERIEVIVHGWNLNRVLQAMKTAHPYEEVAHFVVKHVGPNQEFGSGMVGDLKSAVTPQVLMEMLKDVFHAPMVRHTRFISERIQRIAICGGAGFFLLEDAIRAGADILITSDVKYHEFFDADNRIILADIGHFESEQHTIQLLVNHIREKFTTFATQSTGVIT